MGAGAGLRGAGGPVSAAVKVLPAPPKRSVFQGRSVGPYNTRRVTCDGPAYALGGGSLWCLRCLQPFVDAGKGFQPSITVRRQAVTA